MDIRMFILESLSGKCPLNANYIRFYDEQQNCCNCKDKFFTVRKTHRGKLWCVDCYIQKYCNIVCEKGGFIITNKTTGRLLFNNTANIERAIASAEIEGVTDEIAKIEVE